MSTQNEIQIARAKAQRDAAIAFSKIDLNKDGVLDRDEIEKLVSESDICKDNQEEIK